MSKFTHILAVFVQHLRGVGMLHLMAFYIQWNTPKKVIRIQIIVKGLHDTKILIVLIQFMNILTSLYTLTLQYIEPHINNSLEDRICSFLMIIYIYIRVLFRNKTGAYCLHYKRAAACSSQLNVSKQGRFLPEFQAVLTLLSNSGLLRLQAGSKCSINSFVYCV